MSPIGLFNLQPMYNLCGAPGNGVDGSQTTNLVPTRSVAVNLPLMVDFVWGGHKGAGVGSGQQGAGGPGDGACRVRQARDAPLRGRAVGGRTG